MQSKKGSTSNTENIKTKVSDRNKGLQRETKIKDLISIWKLNRYTMQTLEYRKKKHKYKVFQIWQIYCSMILDHWTINMDLQWGTKKIPDMLVKNSASK